MEQNKKTVRMKYKRKMLAIARRFRQAWHYCLFWAAKTYVALLHISNDDCWLISERGNEARDNAYVFYLYLKNKHPEVPLKYVISKTSPDLGRIEKSDIVWYKSWKNYVYFVSAGYLISTHCYGYSPDLEFFTSIDKYNLFSVRGKKIYLTHFLLDGRQFKWNTHNRKLDLYVCSSSCDYSHILEVSDYGDSVVKLLGTPRMDNLYNRSSTPLDNTILVMPTWRVDFITMSREEFLSTPYYINFQKLISSSKILDYLNSQNYSLIFYPHIEVQKFIDCFSSESDRVIIGDASKYVVEDLLLSTKFMITDYSSVHLDFALLRKKVAYLQFDREKEFRDRPWGNHYLYERDGFGPLFFDVDSLIEYVTTQDNLDFDPKYEENIKRVFPIFDGNNCERVYNAIREM